METKALPPYNRLTEETVSKLHAYADLLIKTNEKVRLVGPRNTVTLWNAHIDDCLRLLPLLPPSGTVIDVGTGGGLPGAVLAICRPDLRFTLIDSISRKTNALKYIISELEIKNSEVICTRSEDFALKNREMFDCATVRAVSEAGIIAEYLSPLVRVGGSLLAMKGISVKTEITGISGQWGKIGLYEPRLFEYEICGHLNYILSWKKASQCSSVYPRQAGKATKKPWWL